MCFFRARVKGLRGGGSRRFRGVGVSRWRSKTQICKPLKELVCVCEGCPCGECGATGGAVANEFGFRVYEASSQDVQKSLIDPLKLNSELQASSWPKFRRPPFKGFLSSPKPVSPGHKQTNLRLKHLP